MKKLLLITITNLLLVGCGMSSTVEEIPVPEHISGLDYHYNQLTDEQKITYDLVAQAYRNFEKETDINRVSQDDFMYAVSAFGYDHPEAIGLGNYILDQEVEEGEETGPVVHVTFKNLEDIEDLELIQNQIQQSAQYIIDGIPEGASTYDTVKYFFETIINETTYDLDVENSQDLRSIFLQKHALCTGYAKALQYLCDQVGIPCIYANGIGDMGEGVQDMHAWNAVEIDGTWYWVDPTWGEVFLHDEETGDSVNDENYINYFNLCFPDEELFEKHKYTTTGYVDGEYVAQFEYPSATATNLRYCELNGCFFETYQLGPVQQNLLEQFSNGERYQLYLQFGNTEEYEKAVESLLGSGSDMDTIFGPYYGMVTAYNGVLYDDHYAILIELYK